MLSLQVLLHLQLHWISLAITQIKWRRKTVHCPRLSYYIFDADMEPLTWNNIHHPPSWSHPAPGPPSWLLVHHRLLSNSEETGKVDYS